MPITLPSSKTPLKPGIESQTILIYGAPKIGKSTLASHADGALFVATEPGLNSLEVFQVPVTTWGEFLEVCALVATGGHGFKTIVIDTIDNLYTACSEHVLQLEGVKHESDLEYGKGWSFVNTEFKRVLTKLAALPYGLIMISHATDRSRNSRTGKYTITTPTLSDSARKVLMGMVDIILFCDIDQDTDNGKIIERRVMKTKAAKNYEAGDRTGKLPDTLPLDFAALKSALQSATKPTETIKESKNAK